MRALAGLDVEPDRLCWRDAPPITLRPTGPGRVHLVQAAGGPVGGDDLALNVSVAAGAELTVRSAAATVVQPGPVADRVTWLVTARVGANGTLRWWPEPTVVCAGADHHGHLRVELAADARLMVRDQVVLGRAGEPGGRYRGRTTVYLAGEPLVDNETVLDGADAALSGPAGSGGFRVFGSVLLAGPDLPPLPESAVCEPGVRAAVLALDGPGYLALALGATSTQVDAILTRLITPDGGGRQPHVHSG